MGSSSESGVSKAVVLFTAILALFVLAAPLITAEPKAASVVEGTVVLSPSVMDDVITAAAIESASYFEASPSLIATLISTGAYPAPRSGFRSKVRNTIEKLEGDVYQLAIDRARTKFYRSSAVVIARGDLQVDSMAAVAYAKSQNLPVFLTKPDELPIGALDAILALRPTKIIILGGEKAVSGDVEFELRRAASQNLPVELLTQGEVLRVEVERLWGSTRYETAVEIAKKMGDFKTLVITNGENPGPEAAIVAAAYDAPIIYVTLNAIPESVKAFLSDRKLTSGGRPMKIVLVDVSDAVETEIRNITITPELGSKLEVVLSNKDNNDVYVELFIDKYTTIINVERGVARSYGPIKLAPGAHTIKIRWLDPSTDVIYEKEETITLAILEQATKTLIIDEHTISERK